MNATHPSPGFCLPARMPSTMVDPEADDLESEIVSKLLPILADRAYSVFDLCDLASLNLEKLADLLESPIVEKALHNAGRILAVRLAFTRLLAEFTAASALTNIAAATPMTAAEADQTRKAADKLQAAARDQATPPRAGRPAPCHDGNNQRAAARPEPIREAEHAKARTGPSTQHDAPAVCESRTETAPRLGRGDPPAQPNPAAARPPGRDEQEPASPTARHGRREEPASHSPVPHARRPEQSERAPAPAPPEPEPATPDG